MVVEDICTFVVKLLDSTLSTSDSRYLNDLMQQYVDGLPVPGLLDGGLLSQPEKAGAGQGQELLQSVLGVVVAAQGEEATKQLVHCLGQAVNVVSVALKLQYTSELLLSKPTSSANLYEASSMAWSWLPKNKRALLGVLGQSQHEVRSSSETE